MNILKNVANFWRCWRKPHAWKYDGDTLGGIWISCERCFALDEFLPGLHEPKGGEAVWQKLLEASNAD